MNTLILFYKYVDIQYPEQIKKWQFKICEELGLKGRVILATEGINATLAGEQAHIQRYMELMEQHPLFGGIDFKQSEGTGDYFPRLRIVVKEELVRMGIPPSQLSTKNTGQHLTPAQAHALIASSPDNLLILDTRNRCESKVGTFTNAVTPDIAHFRDFPQYIDQTLDHYKDKQVLMFCTGGIRCERATAYLNEKGVAQKVYQIEGGIQRYVEQFPDGYFRGKNYVFDGRISVRVNDDILGTCEICQIPCDDYTNCLNASCNKHFICCAECEKKFNTACSEKCMELVAANLVPKRPPLKPLDTLACANTRDERK